MKAKILEGFSKVFGDRDDIKCYFAPGRVNLIGEHTDYNGGHVFPCALTIGTYAAVAPRTDMKVRLYSLNFEGTGIKEADLSKPLNPCADYDWANYPLGVMWAFDGRGMKMSHGLDIVIAGDIPAGSGLSSSASFEVLTGYILRDRFGFEVTNQDLALIGQYSENNFNGMNCGIMDQFASAMGKADNAIFLDTATLNFEYAPIKLNGAKIVVTNSLVKHSLVTSAYNDRRNESNAALKALQAVIKCETLGDLSEEQFEANKDAITDEVAKKRGKHAVYENQRTIKAVEALKNNDLETFGKLMNASHISLRDDYETSCPECDVLAETAWSIPGVIGSRITGGGFGGCTVSIVKDEAVENFKEVITKTYEEKVGKTPEIYVVEIGDGPRTI
ncbi:MAG: galactokinase [Lachnospiraceae bacterium]|nr:galactokinase [Lachnospiraceae bacterium]